MPQLDLLAPAPVFQSPHPMASLCVSSPMWCHVPLGKGRTLTNARRRGGSPRGVRTILEWLLECGGQHRLELRMAASGGHAGIWLGLAGVGATRRNAEATGRRGKSQLADALLAMKVGIRRQPPPALPRRILGLAASGPQQELQSTADLPATRAALPECSRAGAPLVLRIQFDLSRASRGLVSEAHRTLRVAANSSAPDPGWVMSRTGEVRRVDTPLTRAGRVLDEAAALRLRVLVHGRTLALPLRMRILSDALQDDLGGQLHWAEEAEPLHCGVSVLEDGLRVLTGRRGPGDDDFMPT